MRAIHLNRKQKILRNLLVSGLLGLVVYILLGFPPYTVRGMLARIERDYLLPDLEPILVDRTEYRYSTGFWNETEYNTYLLARAGDDTYLYTMYSRRFLKVRAEYRRNLKMGKGALCTARDGTLYVAGPFGDVAAATAKVTAQKTTQYYTQSTDTREIIRGETRTFTLQGEKAGEELLTFQYRGEEAHSRWDLDDVPESEYNLEDAASEWYNGYVRELVDETDDGSRGVLHADLPVHVTLYGEDGRVLDTLDLTVDNYELFFHY